MPKLLVVLVVVIVMSGAARADGGDGGPPGVTPEAEVREHCAPGVHSRSAGRVAIGLARGHVELDGDDEREGTQRSLIARVNGRRGWAVELELSKLRMGDDDGRLASGALIKAFGRRRIAPYVLAGAGGGKLDRIGGEAHMKFGELGGGLMLRGRRVSIGAELRRGVRRVDGGGGAEAMDLATGRVVSPGDDDDRERYTRGRIVALVHF